MAEAGMQEPESLEARWAREDAETDAMLKEAGVDVGTETVDEPVQTDEVLLDSPEMEIPEAPTEEAAPEPEPEPTPEPEPPPVVAEPEKRKPDVVWKALREAERRAKEAEAKLEELRLKSERQSLITDTPLDDLAAEEFADPIAQLEAKQKSQEQELQALKVQARQKAITDTVLADETRFSQEVAPDYVEARQFLYDKARERFQYTGQLEETTELVLEKLSDVIDKVMISRGVTAPTAEEVQKVAEDIAFMNLFEAERVQFVNRHVAKGRSVAQAAYDLAKSHGYSPRARETEVATDVTPSVVTTDQKRAVAQARVKQQAKVAAASQSLSVMQNGGPSKGLQVRTKAEFMKLSPKEQDAFTDKMEEINPDWLQNLPD